MAQPMDTLKAYGILGLHHGKGLFQHNSIKKPSIYEDGQGCKKGQEGPDCAASGVSQS
jgi:hypothetical protein